MNRVEQRIGVQCGSEDVPAGEPEPWTGDVYMDKLKGECDRVGTGVRVTWSEQFDSVVDYGVSVVFPWIDSQPDVGCVVFFPEPDPMSDKGALPEPEWQTLWDLLKNPDIVEVLFYDIQRPAPEPGRES